MMQSIMHMYTEIISNYKLKNDISDYIEQIINVLKYNLPWHVLNTNLHYTTYYKFYKRLIDNNIIKIAFRIINLIYIKKNNNHNKNYFIDATNIRNMNGSDKLGINTKDKNKKGNKISVIVDAYGMPISIKVVKGNKHDIRILFPNINNIKSMNFLNVDLIGDKGYVSSYNKKMLKVENINMIYPYRKNQKKKNSEDELLLLKKRVIVENFFCWLKKFRRIVLRYDSFCRQSL